MGSSNGSNQRVANDAGPAAGQVWAIKRAIKDANGRLLEHSMVPVLVVILRKTGSVFEVAPISFETDLAGAFDVLVPSFLQRPALVETWLRMPVTRRALKSLAGDLEPSVMNRVRSECSRSLIESAPELEDNDPRRAYRQDERLRVIFAMAGTGEELILSNGLATDETSAVDVATAKALRLKRDEPASPRWHPQAAEPANYPGFVAEDPPAGASRTPEKDRIPA
jgi:hypothetical protein